MISTSTIANALKETLKGIMSDDDGIEPSQMRMVYEEQTMKDNYEDFLETAGPGLASETAEGEQITMSSTREGYMKRFRARKFALGMTVTDEAMEDNKYPEAIKAARRLKRSMVKTIEVSAALKFHRAWDTDYPGGDDVPLFSESHPLAQGGTFSNTLATPLSPSRVALQTVVIAMGQMPGHDGIKEGYEPVQIICPYPQRFVWRETLGSEYAPETGEFNRINVMNKDFNLQVAALLFWDNTTTNWCVKSNVDEGFMWLWRRKMKSASWIDNDRETVKHKQSARWDNDHVNPRCAYGSQI